MEKVRGMIVGAAVLAVFFVGFWPVSVARGAADYRAAWSGQSDYQILRPGESARFEVRLLNTGTEPWYRTAVNLGTDRDQDRIPDFIREDRMGGNGSGWLSPNRVSLTDAVINPGQIGTFRFYYTVPTTLEDGTYREYFRPVADGVKWLDDLGIYWDITVDRGYHAGWISQNGYHNLATNESYQFEVHLLNTGSASWTKDTVRLGTARPQDRIPVFIREDKVNDSPSGWVSPNRVQMVESNVAPGGTATFRFYYTVPATLRSGTYREYFRPVADGVKWLEDQGIYWDIHVTNPLLPENSNPLTGAVFFVDPNSAAAAQVLAWQTSRPADAAQIQKIASEPQAIWLSGKTPTIDEAKQKINYGLAGSRSQNAVPIFVLYTIPQRDCGGLAAGGFGSAENYRTWVDAVAATIGSTRSVVIVEPDALPGLDCLSPVDQQTRMGLIKYAVQRLKQLGNTAVYIDAGNPGWKGVSIIVPRLKQSGIEIADGFSLNAASTFTTADNIKFGTSIAEQVGGKHFVIDTSRNGLGPHPDLIWCNPPGRALGNRPTTNTGNPLVDAYLWIKAPGYSDGFCRDSAVGYGWWPDYALGLAQRANY